MLKYQKLFLLLFSVICLSGCAGEYYNNAYGWLSDHREPDRPPITTPVPNLTGNKARVYIFMGHEFAYSATGPQTYDFDWKSGFVYIEGMDVAYINKEDIFICDIPVGKYDFSWSPNLWYEGNNQNTVKPITLDLKKGDTVFLEGNMKDLVDTGMKWATLSLLKGWLHYLEENAEAGKEALKTRKIVEYRDYSKEKIVAR